MCQSISCTLPARVPVVLGDSTQHNQNVLICILGKQISWAKQTFLDWIVLPGLINTGRLCAFWPDTEHRQPQLGALQWRGQPRHAAEPRGTQGEQQNTHPTASTANNPLRKQHPHFWAEGMKPQRCSRAWTGTLLRGERQELTKPAAVAHSSCQPNPDSCKSWHKPVPFLDFILI